MSEKTHTINKIYARNPKKLIFDDGVEVDYVRCNLCNHFRSPDHGCDGCEIKELQARVKELEASIIKMIKCKGRYHTEQNTIALAKLVGIDLPATEQPCKHDWKSIDPEHLSGIIECQACGTRTISSPVKILLPSPREYELVQQLAEAYCEAIQPAIDAGVIEVIEE